MFFGRRRQSHTGSRLLLPACLAGGAQATALALHTGGKQHEIVQDWRIPAKKGRSSTPLSTSPTSVSTQRRLRELLARRRKYTNCNSRHYAENIAKALLQVHSTIHIVYYLSTELLLLKRSIYLPMENYGLQKDDIYVFFFPFIFRYSGAKNKGHQPDF